MRTLLTWFLFGLLVWCFAQLVWTHSYTWALLAGIAGIASWVVIDDD